MSSMECSNCMDESFDTCLIQNINKFSKHNHDCVDIKEEKSLLPTTLSVSSNNCVTLSTTTAVTSSANSNVTSQEQKYDFTTSNTGSNSSALAKECASCGQLIWDRYVFNCVDRLWHASCLKCSCCQGLLADLGGSCFAKAGMLMCRNDYLRLFGRTGSCVGCGSSIAANEFVMKVHGPQGGQFFHLNCFCCVICHHKLTSGDRYCYIHGHLLCELDYPRLVKGLIQLPYRMSHRS